MQGRGEKAGMFAGAVIMESRRIRSVSDENPRRLLGYRAMWSAHQMLGIQTDSAHPGGDPAYVLRFTPVRGASEGDFLIGNLKMFGRARFDQRQSLKRLYGRAGKDRLIDVTPRGNRLSARFHDNGGSPVATLDAATASDHDDQRVHAFHFECSSKIVTLHGVTSVPAWQFRFTWV
jgi:hypothetical protein